MVFRPQDTDDGRVVLFLSLGWAMTVHKSQGTTLDEVAVNLDSSFAPGQIYVALSRVRRLDDLYVTTANQKAMLGKIKNIDRAALKAYGQFEGKDGEWSVDGCAIRIDAPDP
eukprot:Trichotokara_eunicae@DN5273_c0_g1_i3.p1